MNYVTKIKNFRSIFFWIHFFFIKKKKTQGKHTYTYTVFSQSNKERVSIYPSILYHL